jgi:hypothetical protein
MAREVQFTTLPDLFFSTHPQRQGDVDIVVERERGQFNRKVREVLKRKLRSFLTWKEETYEEIKNRRRFTLKYLRQHFEIIKMYMTWVRPYLRNIQRLQLDQSKTESPDLIIAFESSMIEVEILAVKPVPGGMNQCILMHYFFRTRPEMNYSQEYQRGPLHLGRVEIDFRAYGWTDKEIESYKRMRDQEDFRLLGVIDGSVKSAMESLGDELMRYLKEAGEEFEEKKEMPKAPPKRSGPFMSVFGGFAELFNSFRVKKEIKESRKKPKQTDIMKEAIARSKAEDAVKKVMWNTYHHFKKQHDMLNW